MASVASQKQLAIASLKLASETCNAALQSIDKAHHPPTGPDLNVLRKDFVSILSLLYGSTTKLSLALKPSSPTYTASQEPLKNITAHVSALSHCVCLFGEEHGVTLIHEITSVGKDVVRSVLSLLELFLAIQTNDKGESMGKADDGYMVKIGTVHDVINCAQSGLSKDNAGAVLKKLSQNHEAIQDGLAELHEMVTTRNGADETTGNNDLEDDGWGELGLDSRRPMTDDELERSKKVYAILRLSSALHERIIRDISDWSQVSSEWPSHLVQHLDSLPSHSSALVIAFDDMVATMYTPQDPSDITSELFSYIEVIDKLQSHLLSFFQDPTTIKWTESIRSQGSSRIRMDSQKWSETCFNQLEKASESLQSILKTDK